MNLAPIVPARDTRLQLLLSVRACANEHHYPPLWIAPAGDRARFQLPVASWQLVLNSAMWSTATLFDVWVELRRTYHAEAA